MGDTGLEPVTSCVSSRHSTSGTALTTPRTAFFGVKTGVGEPFAVALRWRYGGATLVLQGSRHQTDTATSRVSVAVTSKSTPILVRMTFWGGTASHWRNQEGSGRPRTRVPRRADQYFRPNGRFVRLSMPVISLRPERSQPAHFRLQTSSTVTHQPPQL